MSNSDKLDNFLKSEFTGSIRVIDDSDFLQMGVSRGSFVSNAKSLMPEEFDASGNIDVLPVFFNLAKVNEFNANGDGISTADAIDMVKRFANKPINIEHKKKQIVGHIISASFSDQEPDFQENDIEAFRDRKDPFYINAAGVIYRHIYPDLAELIIEASSENEDEYMSISTSWELGFKEWVVAKGSNILQDCEIIEGEAVEEFKPFIKKFGGNGFDSEGSIVNRLIVGQTYPLGGALTYNPAAKVKGVFTHENSEDEAELEKNNAFLQKNTINSSLITKNIVKIKKITEDLKMDEEQFKQFLDKLDKSIASVTSEESQAKSISLIFKDALDEQGKTWKSKIATEQEAKAKLEKEVEELKTSFESSKKELDQVRVELQTKASADLFNSRMNFLEEKFELSEKEMEFVVAEVKGLESDEATFESYKEKVSVLFSHKLKETIAANEKEAQEKIEAEVAKRLAAKQGDTETSSASTEASTETDLETEEANAAVTNNNGQSSDEESLIQKLKQSFSVEITK